jgi:putative ABC transport system permease protein
MSALGRVVRSGVGRRRVQTVVIGLIVMIAVTSGVLGGTLMVASEAPFDRAFSQQRGAHLAVQFDGSNTTTAQLSATAHLSGVTAAAGPFPTVQITPAANHRWPPQPVVVAGRDDPGGAVDRVTLLDGRWVRGPGEIVLHSDGSLPPGFGPQVGESLRVDGLGSSVSLTIVGTARSVSETAGGWVAAEQVAALAAPDAVPTYQMLYRFASAETAAQVEAGRAAIEASLPEAAVAGSRSWLVTKAESSANTLLLVPSLIAFGVLSVLMAVLIIGNVIAGAVSTGTRRIGVLKALGFTPRQVVRAFVGQALIPAAVGALVGVVTGNLLALAVLAQTDRIYGTSDSGVAVWVDVVVVVASLALVSLTASLAASRAGRLRTVEVLAVGRTPRPGRGQVAARLSGRLPLPRPVTLGLAHPFAHPLRAATIVAAIAFGAAAATFSVGLGTSLATVQATERHGEVIVQPRLPAFRDGPPAAPDPAAVVAAITSLPGTAGYSGVAYTEVTVAGLTKPVEVRGLTGSDTSYGYELLDGRWFAEPGEIVVAKPFLTATNTSVGDSVVLTDKGKQIIARIVGETFNLEDRGMQLVMPLETFAATDPELRAFEYFVNLHPGTDPEAYTKELNTALVGTNATARVEEYNADELIIVINTLTTLLTVLLLTVAALGVLNMVVLETRERVHDLGVHKALGMTPRQTIGMVIASVVVTGLIGGAIGAPAGVLLHDAVVTAMGDSVGLRLPDSVIAVYSPTALLLFGLGGLAIAVVGALMPAGWAARTRTATALRTE